MNTKKTLTDFDNCSKTPHHTAQSWASYWSNHHDLPDKILAAAHGESCSSEEEDEEDEDASSLGEGNGFPPRRRPKYYESSLSSVDEGRRSAGTEANVADGDDDGSDDGSNDDEDDDDDDDDDSPVRVYDEREMGSGGGPFTEADLYVTAKYVVSLPDFDNLSGRERWDPFHERVSEFSQSRVFSTQTARAPATFWQGVGRILS